jgi:cellobiose phosphorylase
MGTYGDFSDDGLEFIVHTPEPPRDWFNFFWNGTYLACVAQNMNGFSLYQSDEGVVTNLFGKQDMRDDPRWIYVRDNTTGEVWSAGRFPCLTEHDEFECRHGLGYSILRTLRNGIRVTFRVFVPRHHSGEVWTVTLTNESARPRDLSVFSVANIMLDGVNMPYGYVGGLSACQDEEGQYLFFKNMTRTVVDEKYRAFMYSDCAFDAWDVSKDYFLGSTRSYACPQRVMEGKLGCSVASAEHLIGALQHNLTLAPGTDRTINIVLGVVLDRAAAIEMMNACGTAELIEAEFSGLKETCIKRLGRLTVETQDKEFNRLFSVWLKHELYLMADWARFYFKGYRDACQDAAGMSIINPERAQEMLKKALANQRSDGFCPRAFRVASMDIAAADKHYADSPSWISLATDAILCETGDLSFLDEVVPYSDTGEGTVWEHNLKATEFLWADRGEQGLSRIHYGDWNDLMDKVGSRGKGQGVWMSFALAHVLKTVGRIADWRGETELQDVYAARYDELKDAILKHGWDGDHFIYAINDDGMRIGSNEAEEGKVFINPQSWALLSGVIGPEQYADIAERIEPIVDTPVGPVHNWPPFTEYHPGIGQLSGTPPGFFTNGNVYCHAASFKIAADFEAGRIDKAFDTFRRILPGEEKSEPYSQANGYVGPTALRMAHHVSDDPWRTGTVAWNFLNCVDRLLGFRRRLGGFELKPLLPSCWNEASFVRPFRGTDFRITIKRTGVNRLQVNGEFLSGCFVEVPVSGLAESVDIVCEIE